MLFPSSLASEFKLCSSSSSSSSEFWFFEFEAERDIAVVVVVTLDNLGVEALELEPTSSWYSSFRVEPFSPSESSESERGAVRIEGSGRGGGDNKGVGGGGGDNKGVGVEAVPEQLSPAWED